MSPNNERERLGGDPDDFNSDTKNARQTQGSTTILPKGTVESRGNGTVNSHDVVSNQIQDFLRGEGKLSLKAEFRAFFTVWMFVTRLPGPSWVDHHPGYLMRGMCYFSTCGTLIGIFVSTFYDMTSMTLSLPLSISSIISEVSSLWVTGCFHEDGLADSADGIGGGWTSEQILKIMTDTRLGTYGCAILLLYIIAKVELIAILGISVWKVGDCAGGGPAIIVTHALSRLVAPMMVKTREYVDEQGPKYRFYSFFLEAKHLVTWSRVLFASVTSLLISSIAYGMLTGLFLVAAVGGMAFFSGRYAEYLLGGVVGDYLGASICVTEVVLLTILLLLKSSKELALVFDELSEIYSKLLDGVSSSYMIDILTNNGAIFSLLKFLAVIFFTCLWCSNVGHPPVFVRKTANMKEETNNDQVVITRPISDGKDDFKMAINKCEMDKFLLDSSTTFNERFFAVQDYLDSLAKPVGSLGTVEDWASRLAALQRSIRPKADSVVCLIFAADHGVAKDKGDGGMNCSAYPQEVTRKVVQGLDQNLAGASVLCNHLNVHLRVIDVGLANVSQYHRWSGGIVRSSEHKMTNGTENFCKGNAMTVEQVHQCISTGKKETGNAIDEMGCTVVAFGEVGIGNTTASAALIAALTGLDAESVCGAGASKSRDGFNDTIVKRKVSIVKSAMSYHGISSMIDNPYKALSAVGGAEISAIIGGILEASQRDVTVLVDGFICSTAAMIACQIDPSVCRIILFATESTERGQAAALDAIQKIAFVNGIPQPVTPALSMNLRMGEATGALMAVPLVQSACAILSDLGTLDEVLALHERIPQ